MTTLIWRSKAVRACAPSIYEFRRVSQAFEIGGHRDCTDYVCIVGTIGISQSRRQIPKRGFNCLLVLAY